MSAADEPHRYEHWGLGHMSHPEDPQGCCEKPRDHSVHHDWSLEGDPDEEVRPGVTRRDARMLAQHTVVVQGGFSDPWREADRLADDVKANGGEVGGLRAALDKMATEVAAAVTSRLPPADRAELARGKVPDAELAAVAQAAAGVDEADAMLTDADAPPPDPEAGQVPLDLVRRYKHLREMQAASDAESTGYKEEANAIEGQLIDLFSEAGLQNVNIDGKTVFLKRTTFAQRKAGVTAEDVQAALVESGAGDLVKQSVNANTLSAWVRELVDVDDAPGLPEPAAAVLELGEKFSIGINAAGSRRRK